VDYNEAKREESLQEKQAHLDIQNVIEQHYNAKVGTQIRASNQKGVTDKNASLSSTLAVFYRQVLQVKELEIRLELAEARQRQAELTAAEHQHQAKAEAANFEEASRLLTDMGEKYKQFEAGMKDNAEVHLATHCPFGVGCIN
jgi:hypothetical protein